VYKHRHGRDQLAAVMAAHANALKAPSRSPDRVAHAIMTSSGWARSRPHGRVSFHYLQVSHLIGRRPRTASILNVARKSEACFS